ncbi:MAG: tRNA glutamyl-Q(34) synthetase GluQRS [Muribaculaceae bacterium]|nr:tRNA glutamyl-Q(34) synthetase GluQRS [Muribaculaceae bacterium]
MEKEVKGRFAPSPTGRMHLGNLFAALLSWLSVRSQGGKWVLRMEDLDPQRSKREYMSQIEDDLHWLGLDWDEGGLEGRGDNGPYVQSRRHALYEEYLERLRATGLTYPCRCTRADILATQAPHRTDGRVVYAGTCRPATMPCHAPEPEWSHSTRLYIPQGKIAFTDRLYGQQAVDPSEDCGDIVLRRADGAWAYQLAVVVDDALMGITEVVRGSDLLESSARQIYLYGLLGLEAPEFAHVPLLCDSEGRRLSKRDRSLAMDELRARHTPEEITGRLAALAGLRKTAAPVSAAELVADFDWKLIPAAETLCAYV